MKAKQLDQQMQNAEGEVGHSSCMMRHQRKAVETGLIKNNVQYFSLEVQETSHSDRCVTSPCPELVRGETQLLACLRVHLLSFPMYPVFSSQRLFPQG